MPFARHLLLSVSLFSVAFAASAQAQAPAPAAAIPSPAATPADPNAPITRKELPALIREVILNEPDIVLDAAKKLRAQQVEEARQKTAEAIAKNKQDLFANPNSPAIGDANTADVTLVEFFDYHCGYCRTILPVLTQLANEDKKLRIVFKEFPILGDESVLAARAALAVHRIAPDKYFDFHTALMGHEGSYTDKTIDDMVKKIGVDPAKVKAEAAKPEITAILDKNREIAKEINITGTPAIVLGSVMMPGAVPIEELKEAIAKERGVAPAKPAIGEGKKEDAPAPAPAPAPAAKQ